MLRKIALAAILLAFFMVAPALAEPDTTYYASPAILNDDNSGIQIEINYVIASDLPHGSYIFTYPPDQYRYYTLYYTRYNPTDHDVRYQFKINFMDSNGTVYQTEDNTLATGIGAGRRVSDEIKEFPVPRNATGLYIRWEHINPYLNQEEWTNINISTQPVATPTPAPSATATATPVPATPTATAKPTPADGLLPALAIGIVASAFVLARISRK